MSGSENEFEQGDSGALNTELAEAGRMKPGSLIIMKEQFPCKVTAFSTAKPGKHGSAKAMITAKDIFTDKQYDETFGTGDMIPRPIVTKKELQLIDLEDDSGMLTLMDGEGNTKEDMNLPTEAHLKDVTDRIKVLFADGKDILVTCQKWGDRE
jgi:translation initiation factor 5A